MRAGRQEWVGLAVLALPTLLVSIDVFVMLLALPQPSAALGAGRRQPAAVGWITYIYGFMVAGFLVTMGALGTESAAAGCCCSGRLRSLRSRSRGRRSASVLCLALHECRLGLERERECHVIVSPPL